MILNYGLPNKLSWIGNKNFYPIQTTSLFKFLTNGNFSTTTATERKEQMC